MSTYTPTDMPTGCDRCGGTLSDGYEVRRYPMERETGYVQEEYICAECCELESKDEDRYAAADQKFTEQFE